MENMIITLDVHTVITELATQLHILETDVVRLSLLGRSHQGLVQVIKNSNEWKISKKLTAIDSGLASDHVTVLELDHQLTRQMPFPQYHSSRIAANHASTVFHHQISCRYHRPCKP
ncbi:MAG: hypothetical protein GY749_12430 [Desulfobacteraceae bacterium]|nr:hypothetical protein [Desulfobacteraceae bacterium]